MYCNVKVRYKPYKCVGFNVLTAGSYVTDGAGASLRGRQKTKVTRQNGRKMPDAWCLMPDAWYHLNQHYYYVGYKYNPWSYPAGFSIYKYIP